MTWKIQTTGLIIGFLYIGYVFAQPSQIESDISATYQRVSQTNQFDDRKKLVQVLRQRMLTREQAITRKKEKTLKNETELFHISIFKDFYDQVQKADSKQCVQTAKNLEYSLHRTRHENNNEIFPYERSLYNLFGKMCSLDFVLLSSSN